MTAEYLSDQEYEELLKAHDYSFKAGDIVKGKVLQYGKDGVSVDISAKANALCPENEAKMNSADVVQDILKKGESYDFLICSDEDEDGCFIISYKKVALAHNWQQLEEIKAKNEIVTGKVLNVVKGGILVDVMGVKGFVPSSHLRNRDVENIVNTEIELKILTLDMTQNNFVLSNKKVFTDNAESIKKDIFSQLEVGQVVKGTVVRIADFGAFVDIGGVDALLPLSQISWKWVEHPSDVLKVGDKINVEIIGVDFDKAKVSLSLKNLEPDPWVETKGKISEGEKIKGKITRIRHFGAFVEVYPSVEALLPQSELQQYQEDKGSMFDVGDVIDVVVLKFNPDDRRISLTLKDTY